jgi:hypothetical protein
VFSSNLVDLFVHDKLVVAMAVLVVLDIALGVLAAFKLGTFNLSYVSDFFRNDVLYKLLPYYVLWAALHISDTDFDFVGLNAIDSAFALFALAALAASILKSLSDLGFAPAKALPDAISGADPNARV